MRRISQRLAEQAFGRRGMAQPREHEVDRRAAGIDGSVEVAPTALDTNVGLIDTLGLMGWPEMTAQPLLQFGTVALDPVLAHQRLTPLLFHGYRLRPELELVYSEGLCYPCWYYR